FVNTFFKLFLKKFVQGPHGSQMGLYSAFARVLDYYNTCKQPCQGGIGKVFHFLAFAQNRSPPLPQIRQKHNCTILNTKQKSCGITAAF
ncbi:MAG: hypothetical protein J1F60_08455, partial [Oscillospiraceae bacterium]|nr:hypothetical protein [Oscillospiraceae bacterium]